MRRDGQRQLRPTRAGQTYDPDLMHGFASAYTTGSSPPASSTKCCRARRSTSATSVAPTATSSSPTIASSRPRLDTVRISRAIGSGSAGRGWIHRAGDVQPQSREVRSGVGQLRHAGEPLRPAGRYWHGVDVNVTARYIRGCRTRRTSTVVRLRQLRRARQGARAARKPIGEQRPVTVANVVPFENCMSATNWLTQVKFLGRIPCRAWTCW